MKDKRGCLTLPARHPLGIGDASRSSRSRSRSSRNNGGDGSNDVYGDDGGAIHRSRR